MHGIVRGYIDDYAATVQLDNGMEAMLHRRHVPNAGYENIEKHLDLGDEVIGVVEQIDKSRLAIRISISSAIEQHKQAENALRQEEPWPGEVPEEEQDVPTLPPSHTLSSETSILVIDDDEPFCRSLHTWLKRTGAQVSYATTLERLQQYLGLDGITHFLVDYNLDNPQMEGMVRQILSSSKAKVAIISGNWNEASLAAKKKEYPFFPKPISLAHLIHWLRDDVKPNPEQLIREKGINPFWHGSRQEQEILRMADRMLEELCQKSGCLGALWVVQERPGNFTLRAKYGLDETGLKPFSMQIRNSVLATVLETGEEEERAVHKSGPLRLVAPKLATHLWTFPLETLGFRDRAVLFFRSSPFDRGIREWITSQQPRMRDLVERMLLVQHLRESEAFATMGRVNSGLLHEVRNQAAPLNMVVTELQRLLSLPMLSPDLPYLRELLTDAAKTTESLLRLIQSDLSMIQKEQVEKLPVNRTAQRIVRLFRRQIDRNRIRLEFHPAPFDITVSLPPAVMEQPLINLLDNAIYHIGSRDWGRVVVRVLLDWTNLEQPIRIEVEDNGFGMKARDRDRLFSARATVKGTQGVGMGLYVSRNLVRSVGGELEMAKSLRWLGSRFVIQLPAQIGTLWENTP
ncbi:MAG: ATP-binding protein [Magnetococcus sp. XQGC-1]